ncbi:MAG: hypothetical protein AABM33_11540 [Pseudomonadota bacterium]
MKRIIIAVAAAILAAGLAYAAYGTYQKRELRAQVVEVVAAASGQLDQTLGIDINAPSAGLAERLDAGVARAETALQQLRALSVRRDPALVEAADQYVAGVLEVLRRQAGGTRHRSRFIEDRKALDAHMARAGARSETWISEAIRLKQRLDQDYYDYQLTVTSLGNMLAGLVDARRKVAERLPSVPLPAEAAVRQARERTLAAAAAAKQELEQARRLVSPG